VRRRRWPRPTSTAPRRSSRRCSALPLRRTALTVTYRHSVSTSDR
jgi:hypothetical protein